jgi:hypothetical protein
MADILVPDTALFSSPFRKLEVENCADEVKRFLAVLAGVVTLDKKALGIMTVTAKVLRITTLRTTVKIFY